MHLPWVALLLAMCLAGCASRAKHFATEAPASSAERTPSPEARAEQPQRCDSPCTSGLPRVQIVLPLRSADPALVNGALENQLRPLARALEGLREKLLACGADPRPVTTLAQHRGELSVEFRGRDLPDTDTACLRAVLKGGLTPGLVHDEVAVAMPDQPQPVPGVGLSKDQIRSVIQQHIAEFHDCLLEHVDSNLYEMSALDYLVHFQVDKAGEVRCVEPQNRDPALVAFSCCFLPQLLRWRFPALAEGSDYVEVNYPFVVESS